MSEIQRPEPLPFDCELARRANAPRYRPERIASAVAYHAGPEIGITAVLGGSAAILVHPVALPIVAALTAVWATIDRLIRWRGLTTPRTKPSRIESGDTRDEAGDSAEGVA